MLSDFIQTREDCIMVGNRLLSLVTDAVGHFSGLHHAVHMSLDECRVGSYGFYEFQIPDSQGVRLLFWENLVHLVDIVDERTLIFCRDRHYMVQRQISEYAGFYLYLLRVCLPFDLIPSLELLSSHHP